MNPQDPGTQPNTELGQLPTPSAPELAPQQTAPPVNPDGSAAIAPSPDLAALQSQLAQAEQARQLAELQAKEHQAAFTRSQQQLRALAGATPQQNPLTPYLDTVAKELGLDPGSPEAQYLAKREMQQDQRFQQFQQAQTAQFQVPALVQEVVSKTPGLMSVQGQLGAYLQQEVARGNLDALQPEYARTIGARLWLDAQSGVQPNQPQLAPQGYPPAFQSMTGPTYGYQPQAPLKTPQVNPQADDLAKKMAEYTKIPLQQ
jgi:hypothetical protein